MRCITLLFHNESYQLVMKHSFFFYFGTGAETGFFVLTAYTANITNISDKLGESHNLAT